ncbi:CHAT domain-containing protein [Leptolyngbya sp. FACHB-541]|uniref:CHAT domain-containing protein n=1 Tax=Leptolyngbya sp. FACHB-541 TaxID=2692810 RepID=UPI001684150C|nr:CHAT domain-containing protein [Leptolyngbya sp. FACHB-541]MBD2001424.1 CHAT domain-containing protein [Leptolyngbya sp. FACHB-541]
MGLRKNSWLFLISLLLAIALSILGWSWEQSGMNARTLPAAIYAQTADPIELRSQGQTLALQGQCTEAIPILNQALQLYRANSADPTTSDLIRDSNLISEVNIFTHLSRCYFQLEDYGGLLTGLRAGIATRNQLTARSYLSSGAQAGLGQLADWLDSWRNRLATDTERINALDGSRDFFNELTWVLAELGDTEGALVASEKGRTRAIADILFASLSEIPSEQRTIAQTPTLEEIRRTAQDQQVTLVEYAIAAVQNNPEDKLYLWVVRPSGEIQFKSQLLTAGNQSLKDMIQQSRRALGARLRGGFELVESQPVAQREQLRALYQLLIQPIQDWLPENETDRIVFIPQDDLFLVPFPALLDANDQPLIAHHTVLTAPSIQVLNFTHQKREQMGGLGSMSEADVLLVGNPEMPQSPNLPNLTTLPSAADEVNAIATLYNVPVLIGEAASETVIKQRMLNARVIHLATHGLLEDYSGDGEPSVPGAIVLAPDNQNDGLLTSAEILQLRLNAELVVLSACDTGLGNITGDGVIGLARSFFQAGTPSLIVSLWSVPDAPTAELMVEFYRQWQQEGRDKAQALRQAMRSTMANHPDPSNWAAFTLIGEAG